MLKVKELPTRQLDHPKPIVLRLWNLLRNGIGLALRKPVLKIIADMIFMVNMYFIQWKDKQTLVIMERFNHKLSIKIEKEIKLV